MCTIHVQVITEVEEEPPSEEEQLLAALRKKADAFANKDWEAYWLREGPALLTNGWLASHPNIPLAKVEEVCSLEFISSAVKSLSLESSSCEVGVGGGEEGYHAESIMAVSGGSSEEGVKIVSETRLDSEMEVCSAVPEGSVVVPIVQEPEPMVNSEQTASSSVVAMEDKTISVAPKDDSSTDEAALSAEAIVAMWNEHYNSYYWYAYESFVQGLEKGQQQQLPLGDGEGKVKREGEGEESQDSEAMEPQDTEVHVYTCRSATFIHVYCSACIYIVCGEGKVVE